MTPLPEVPGASERPGGSSIVVEENAETREFSVRIAPRSSSFVVGMGAVVLLSNLLAVLWMGVELFFYHRSVGVMGEIAPRDLPAPLLRYSFPLFLGWIGLEGLGAAVLIALVQPALQSERLTFTAEGVQWHKKQGRREQTRTVSRLENPRFRLKRDPQGLTASVLTLHALHQQVVVAEHATEAEREWLFSVCNALLAQGR